jgi:hypothetical protein
LGENVSHTLRLGEATAVLKRQFATQMETAIPMLWSRAIGRRKRSGAPTQGRCDGRPFVVAVLRTF